MNKLLIMALMFSMLPLSSCSKNPPCECNGNWHKVWVSEIQDLSGDETKVVAWGYNVDSKKEIQYVFNTKESIINCEDKQNLISDNAGCIYICVDNSDAITKAKSWYPCNDICEVPDSVKKTTEFLKQLESVYIIDSHQLGDSLEMEYVKCDDFDLSTNEKLKAIATFETKIQDEKHGLDTNNSNANADSIIDYVGCAKVIIVNGKIEFAMKELSCKNNDKIKKHFSSNESEIQEMGTKEVGISWVQTGTNRLKVHMYPWDLIEKEVMFSNNSNSEYKLYCYYASVYDGKSPELISNIFKSYFNAYESNVNPELTTNYLGIMNSGKGIYDNLQVIELNPGEKKIISFPVTPAISLKKQQDLFSLQFTFARDKKDDDSSAVDAKTFNFIDEKRVIVASLSADIRIVEKSLKTETLWDAQEEIQKYSFPEKWDPFIDETFVVGNNIVIPATARLSMYTTCMYYYSSFDKETGKKLWSVKIGEKKEDMSPRSSYLSSDSKHVGDAFLDGSSLNLENGKKEERIKEDMWDRKNEEYKVKEEKLKSNINSWKPEVRKIFLDEMSRYALSIPDVSPIYSGSDFVFYDDKIIFFVNNCLTSIPGVPRGSDWDFQNYNVVLCFDQKTGDKLYKINYEGLDNYDHLCVLFGNYLATNTDLFNVSTGKYLGKFNNELAMQFIRFKADAIIPWKRIALDKDKILLYALHSEGGKYPLKLKMLKIVD